MTGDHAGARTTGPHELPRAPEIAEASAYVEGRLRWIDLGDRAREVVYDWGLAVREDESETRA